MNSQVPLALIGFGVTIVTTGGSIWIAYLGLKKGQTRIEHNTNGNLIAERERTARAHVALESAGVAIPADPAPVEPAA